MFLLIKMIIPYIINLHLMPWALPYYLHLHFPKILIYSLQLLMERLSLMVFTQFFLTLQQVLITLTLQQVQITLTLQQVQIIHLLAHLLAFICSFTQEDCLQILQNFLPHIPLFEVQWPIYCLILHVLLLQIILCFQFQVLRQEFHQKEAIEVLTFSNFFLHFTLSFPQIFSQHFQLNFLIFYLFSWLLYFFFLQLIPYSLSFCHFLSF